MSIPPFRPAVYHDLTTATIEGAAISAALALVEHLSLWSVQDRVPLIARYTLGTAAILAGVSHACRRTGRGDLALAVWAIAAATGATVAAAHGLRHAQPDSLDELLKDGDAHAIWLPSARRAGRHRSTT